MRPEERATEGLAAERRRYVNLPVDVFEDPLLSGDDVRILGVIAAHDWEQNDRGCTASQTTIADSANVSESTVKRAIKRLHFGGYLLAPEPLFRGRERIGTRLRLSGKVRENRPLVAAVDGAVKPTTVPQAQKARRSFANRFRPGVERYPLSEDDGSRLRLLDEWGCTDSSDMLGVMFAAIAERERQCGREPSPTRVRELFDSASRNRRLKRAGIDNRPGFLLNGLESGYLLGHGPKLRVADLPPGAREYLRTYIERASHGEPIPQDKLQDLGVDPSEVSALVGKLRAEEGEEPIRESSQREERAAQQDEDQASARIRGILEASLGQARYAMLLGSATIACEKGRVAISLRTSFARDLAKQIITPILLDNGYDAILTIEGSPRC